MAERSSRVPFASAAMLVVVGIGVAVVGFVLPEGILQASRGAEADDAGSGGDPLFAALDPLAIVPEPTQPDPPELAPDEAIEQLPAEPSPEDPGLDPESSTFAVPRGRILAASGEGEWVKHRAVPFETVDQIAHRYAVRPYLVRMWNGLPAELERPRVGVELAVRARRIPPPRVELEYVVRNGDTWWEIGTRYGIDANVLRSMNAQLPQRLRVGQTIRMWIDPVVYDWIASESGPEELGRVRPGAVGIGTPQDGRLVNGVLLPENPYFHLKLPHSAYGTSHAVAQVLEAIIRFEARSDYARPLTFGSMSRRHGGPLTDHRSHQSGRDLDIRLPLRTRYPDGFAVEPDRVDWHAVWDLVTAFAETGEVMIVFLDHGLQERLHAAAVERGATEEERARILQWPRGSAASSGVVRHAPGHLAHLHVRFTCGAYEPECVQASDSEEEGEGDFAVP